MCYVCANVDPVLNVKFMVHPSASQRYPFFSSAFLDSAVFAFFFPFDMFLVEAGCGNNAFSATLLTTSTLAFNDLDLSLVLGPPSSSPAWMVSKNKGSGMRTLRCFPQL
jgi:hypothetical protein